MAARKNARILNPSSGGYNAYSLAADLIPKRGTKAIRSDKVREFARQAFCGSRAR